MTITNPTNPYYMQHFIVQELVDPDTYKRFGDEAIRYMDPRLISCLNSLRRQMGTPLIINNWNAGGPRKSSGLRIPGDPYHSTYSGHSFGKAVDIVGAFDAEEVRQRIIDGDIVLQYPCRLEAGVSWLHLDTLNTGRTSRVQVFNP